MFFYYNIVNIVMKKINIVSIAAPDEKSPQYNIIDMHFVTKIQTNKRSVLIFSILETFADRFSSQIFPFNHENLQILPKWWRF